MKAFLDGLYLVYNRRELVHPDPLEFLYNYDAPADREIVGLVASCLAYGRVAQILKSVEKALAPLGPRPRDFLAQNSSGLNETYKNFKHRFTTGAHIAGLLERVSKVLRSHGSLEEFMRSCLSDGGAVLPALNIFSRTLSPALDGFSMLSSPEDGSACKRLFLYLKWMVRHDDVDPGGWTVFSPKDLVMPTDTHIHNIARQLGLTERKQADLKTALEITRAFAVFSPDDPTRYDFALTRFGIRGALSVSELIEYASQTVARKRGFAATFAGDAGGAADVSRCPSLYQAGLANQRAAKREHVGQTFAQKLPRNLDGADASDEQQRHFFDALFVKTSRVSVVYFFVVRFGVYQAG